MHVHTHYRVFQRLTHVGFLAAWLMVLLGLAPLVGQGSPADEQSLCEESGGAWDRLSCGHYSCGRRPDCTAVIPGCDCGPMANFQTGAGCVEDLACAQQMVHVVVDMDAETPGYQSSVTVGSCTDTVQGVAVYVLDPLQQHSMWRIGYFGGLNRGISFGHMPGANSGTVSAIAGTPQVPVNPGNYGWVTLAPGFQPGFAGPEVQYMEGGAGAPAIIAAEPTGPIFTVDLTLQNTQPGDRFDFYLLDFVIVWTGGTHGAFSTIDSSAMDSGGDAVPDATSTLYGLDPDEAIAVPPASFFVDYIDGQPGAGPAFIDVVAASGDLDASGTVDPGDLALLLGSWGPCPAQEDCPADLDGSGLIGAADLAMLLGHWGTCGIAQ